LLDRFRPEHSNQFILQILAAGVKAQVFSIASSQRCLRPFTDRTQKVLFFRKVVQAGQPQPQPLTAEAGRKLTGVRGAPDGQHDDPLGFEVQSNASRQCLNRGLIAPTFNKYDRARFGFVDDPLRGTEAQRRAGPRGHFNVTVPGKTLHSEMRLSVSYYGRPCAGSNSHPKRAKGHR
jgi:hypothetical protein